MIDCHGSVETGQGRTGSDGQGRYAVQRLTYDEDVNLTVAYVAGDMDCDGDLDAFDIDPFVLALTDPAGYEQQYPECDINLADINGDGTIDAFDIDPFVELLVGG